MSLCVSVCGCLLMVWRVNLIGLYVSHYVVILLILYSSLFSLLLVCFVSILIAHLSADMK